MVVEPSVYPKLLLVLGNIVVTDLVFNGRNTIAADWVFAASVTSCEIGRALWKPDLIAAVLESMADPGHVRHWVSLVDDPV
jgi:hypothetical protein